MAHIFGCVCKPTVSPDNPVFLGALNYLAGRGHRCLVEQELRFPGAPALVEFVPQEVIGEKADPIISFGGDGTLIRAVYLAQDRSPVVFGVAMGGLGFLTEIQGVELVPLLELFLNHKCSFVERTKLMMELRRDGQPLFRKEVLNDVVIHKEALARIMDLSAFVDDSPLTTFKADGLIICTPTGSTAYNMSAGGPILYPSVKGIVVTPICPHSLSYRPFILSHDKTFTVRVPQDCKQSFLTLNGQIGHELIGGDEISVWLSQHTVRTVAAAHMDYFQTLKSKLRWGER